jgi:xanthine dehydrogenase YagS FAD-binding subunit
VRAESRTPRRAPARNRSPAWDDAFAHVSDDWSKATSNSRWRVVDINHIGLADISELAGGGLRIGALARNSDTAIHAILGMSDACIAVNPSDMNVALAALGATVQVRGPKGARAIPIAEFHRLPGSVPQADTVLAPAELITSVDLPSPSFSRFVHYLKVRDRASYAFALVSVPAALDLAGGVVRQARIAVGGVAHKPWRVPAAEALLVGRALDNARSLEAASMLLAGAQAFRDNRFNIKLAQHAIVRALREAGESA